MIGLRPALGRGGGLYGQDKGTNIELDRDLLQRASTALGGATFKDTVEEGLRRIVAERSLTEFAGFLEDIDPEQRELLLNVRDSAL